MKKYKSFIISIVALAYIVAALIVTQSLAKAQVCTGVDIIIDDANAAASAKPFVSVRELNRDLGDVMATAPGEPLASINTADIEARLRRIDKVESASAMRMSSGRLEIRVVPLLPVARVFDGNRSYYINKDGKRMDAGARYHIDVPVICGRLDNLGIDPKSLLGVIDRIGSDPLWSRYFTAINVDSPHDILLVPRVAGQIVNIGDTSSLDDKLNRLQTFLSEVMPHKGWAAYDTISVKWRGQVVATRAKKKADEVRLAYEDIDEADDNTTMLPSDDALIIKAEQQRKEKADTKQDVKPDSVQQKAEKSKTTA